MYIFAFFGMRFEILQFGMKKFISRNKFGLLMIIPGAIAGFLYWKFVGCNTGTCPITSVWYNSSVYGAIIGYLIGNVIDDRRKKTINDKLEAKQSENFE
jgi:membrane associated rhomboid family serine protease